jgi:hypothetical protein
MRDAQPFFGIYLYLFYFKRKMAAPTLPAFLISVMSIYGVMLHSCVLPRTLTSLSKHGYGKHGYGKHVCRGLD